MKTKFGNVKINNQGYYAITSCKEGNNGKLLHRLVWEYHYGKPVPDGYDIHHINGDKLDNRIQNLQCVEHSVHLRFHKKGENHPMYGKHHSDETKKRMSEVKKGIKRPELLGENNPRAKYTLWDIQSVYYSKPTMFQYGRKPDPCKCFGCKYEGYRLPIGFFHDFVSVEIINKLVENAKNYKGD